MTDQDVDGSHIKGLFINMLHSLWPSLVKRESFVQSLNVQIHKMTNILSYTFIIPILPMLWDVAKSGQFNSQETKEIAIRMVSFAVITVSGIVLKNIMWKIIKRFAP